MNLIEKLPKWFERKPLILLRFDENITNGLHNSSQGLTRFTIAKPHEIFNELKVPTLCLVELATGKDHEFHIGVITSKVAVSTFDSRITVIKMQALSLPSLAKLTDYRMHRDPFFFKFVRRKGDGESHQSFVLSLDHLKKLLSLPSSRGTRGGIRLSYQDLGGAYLRELDLIGLIRSGYIGTHNIESKALSVLINAVAKGNRALVLAWQQRIKNI